MVYHAMNRGNNRAAIFLAPQDYLTFLKALHKTQQRYPFRLSVAKPADDGGVKVRLNLEPADLPRTIDVDGSMWVERGVPRFEGTLQVAHPETTVAEAMAKMTIGRFRHMPVIDRGALVGLISIGDVVKARIMEQEDEVDSLKAYVAGSV